MELTENSTIAELLAAIRQATLIGVKDILTLDECAAFTGYSAATLYVYTHKRLIPHYKRGNSLFFSKKEVENWIKANAVPTAEAINNNATSYVAKK